MPGTQPGHVCMHITARPPWGFTAKWHQQKTHLGIPTPNIAPPPQNHSYASVLAIGTKCIAPNPPLPSSNKNNMFQLHAGLKVSFCQPNQLWAAWQDWRHPWILQQLVWSQAPHARCQWLWGDWVCSVTYTGHQLALELWGQHWDKATRIQRYSKTGVSWTNMTHWHWHSGNPQFHSMYMEKRRQGTYLTQTTVVILRDQAEEFPPCQQLYS